MYHLSFLLFVAMAAITTALPIPTPEDAYIKSEIQRALPGWVGTGAGLGSTLAIPVFGHNPVLAAAAFPAGAAFGGALGGVGATAYGTLAGTVKRVRKVPCAAEDPDPKRTNGGEKQFWQGGLGGGLAGGTLLPRLQGWQRSVLSASLRKVGGFGTGAAFGLLGATVTDRTLRATDPHYRICHRPD